MTAGWMPEDDEWSLTSPPESGESECLELRTPDPQRILRRARNALAELFGSPERRDFAVRFWDGSVDTPGPTSRFTLVLPTPWALRHMFLPPSELRLGEAFVRGDFEIEGELSAAATMVDAVRARMTRRGSLIRMAAHLLALPAEPPSRPLQGRRLGFARLASRHSRLRDRAAVRSHYDIGNEFYALWLDWRMIYSCAYFETGSEDLDTAQACKLDYICRKLRLRPGERLLDIGCGWGGLLRYAAEQYGVRGIGITLSDAQATYANEAIVSSGLAGRCAVQIADYRDLDERRPFDKIVSVGMYEHVGRDRIREYFEKAHRLLRPGGLFLNHGIVAAPARTQRGMGHTIAGWLWGEGKFLDRYVFPDGELTRIAVAMEAAENAGFEVRDIENLREHYVETLRHWVHRLENAESDAVDLVGSENYRVWRAYMAGSAHAFSSGRMGVTQMLLAKPRRDGSVAVPRTRTDLYRRGPAADPRLLSILVERMRGRSGPG